MREEGSGVYIMEHVIMKRLHEKQTTRGDGSVTCGRGSAFRGCANVVSDTGTILVCKVINAKRHTVHKQGV